MRPEALALATLAQVKASAAQNRKRFASESAVLAALTAWFASGAEAVELPPHLLSMLVSIGISEKAAEQAGPMVLATRIPAAMHSSPHGQTGMSARGWVSSQEPKLRAQYLLAAAKRLSSASDWDAALALEQRYVAMHARAVRNRRDAAGKVDAIDTPVLVWRTAGDDRVEPRCAALDGRLFTANRPPDGVLPGAVHLNCRCHAEPWGRGPVLNWGAP